MRPLAPLATAVAAIALQACCLGYDNPYASDRYQLADEPALLVSDRPPPRHRPFAESSSADSWLFRTICSNLWGHGDGSTLPEAALGPTPFGAIDRTTLQQEAPQGGIGPRGIAGTQVSCFAAVRNV